MMITLCLLAVLNGEQIAKDCNGKQLYAIDSFNVMKVSSKETRAVGINPNGKFIGKITVVDNSEASEDLSK